MSSSHESDQEDVCHESKPQPLTASIQSLPPEILLHIFSFLGVNDLCNSVAKVCTQWEQLHWDPPLYKSVALNEDDETTEGIIRLLKMGPQWQSRYYSDTEVGRIMIRSRKIEWEKQQPTSAKHKERIAEMCTDLRMLLPHLHTVHLVNIYNRCSLSLATLLGLCVQLEDLHVFNNVDMLVTSRILVNLSSQLRNTLRVLHIECDKWTAEGMNALRKCHRLEDLAVLNAFVLPDDCLLAIGHMSSLRRLKIAFCSGRSLDALACMFNNNALRHLTTLSLRCCLFNDSVATSISTNLKKLNDFTLMKWTSCNCSTYANRRFIDPTGLLILIKGCNKLEVLEVDCRKNHRLVKALVRIPEYLPGLKSLFALWLPPNTPEWRKEIEEKMPHLAIRENCSRI